MAMNTPSREIDLLIHRQVMKAEEHTFNDFIDGFPVGLPRYTDTLLALETLHELAKQYQAVGLVISDCGCWSISLFVDGCKIIEEDKSLAVVVGQVLERIKKKGE
jgi:hypothetical protein